MLSQKNIYIAIIFSLAAGLIFTQQKINAQNTDPIVGTWIGTVNQPGIGSYSAQLSFITPTKGTSRYPSSKCGGILRGGLSGQGYQFTETINYGQLTPQNPSGCINGTMNMQLVGQVLQWRWSGTHQGQTYTATATFQRKQN